MAHSKQAKKRIKTSEEKRLHNKAIASRMRSAIKQVLTAATSGDVDGAKKALPGAMRQIDKAAKTNIIHSRTAARRKSLMARAIDRAAG